MLGELTSTQLSEWMAYDLIEPFGEEREDFRMGILASTIANIYKSPKRKKPYKAQDFMPSFEVISEEEQIARLRAKARALFRG